MIRLPVLKTTLAHLIFLFLSIISMSTSASVKIQCPCSLTPGSGSTAVLEYGIIFTKDVGEQSGLNLSLLHSATRSLITSTELHGGFYKVGSADLSVLRPSSDAIRLQASFELLGSGFDEGFLIVRLQDSSGAPLDTVILTRPRRYGLLVGPIFLGKAFRSRQPYRYRFGWTIRRSGDAHRRQCRRRATLRKYHC